MLPEHHIITMLLSEIVPEQLPPEFITCVTFKGTDGRHYRLTGEALVEFKADKNRPKLTDVLYHMNGIAIIMRTQLECEYILERVQQRLFNS
jgi:hypothetical protein